MSTEAVALTSPRSVPILLDFIPFFAEIRGLQTGVEQPGQWSHALTYHRLMIKDQWSFATHDKSGSESSRLEKLHGVVARHVPSMYRAEFKPAHS